jgi:hypothetical protein
MIKVVTPIKFRPACMSCIPIIISNATIKHLNFFGIMLNRLTATNRQHGVLCKPRLDVHCAAVNKYSSTVFQSASEWACTKPCSLYATVQTVFNSCSLTNFTTANQTAFIKLPSIETFVVIVSIGNPDIFT